MRSLLRRACGRHGSRHGAGTGIQGVVAGAEGGKGKMDTQHGASQFALIVTAEPHFAVTVPSTMIALYNVADDVKGEESKVETLTQRAEDARRAAMIGSGAAVEAAERQATADSATESANVAAARTARATAADTERARATESRRATAAAVADARSDLLA